MHYIKSIFEKTEDEHTHNKFIRYSKGTFVGPMINIKITKNNIKLNSSFHLNDELLDIMADYIGNKEIKVKGTLSWNKDLAPELEENGIKYLKVVKSRGIFNYKLENLVPLKKFVKNLGHYHLLISFKEDDLKLTSKPKFPKPNKEISGDFVKTIFPIELKDKILKEFAFDVKGDKIKEIQITNDLVIEDIIFPENQKDLAFEDIRKLATRKGTIKRRVFINKDESTAFEKTVEFNV